MPGGRVGLIVGLGVLVMVAVIAFTISGVFNPAPTDEVSTEDVVKDPLEPLDDPDEAEEESGPIDEAARAFLDPFGGLADIFHAGGLRPTSPVTQTVEVSLDPSSDFVHPKPGALLRSDPSVDMLEYIGSAVVSVTDEAACGLNQETLDCGDHGSYFVGCGSDPDPITPGNYFLFSGLVGATMDATGDAGSRRITLVLDDGDPSNDWIANRGNDNDFRQGANTWYHMERGATGESWTVDRVDIAPGSIETTGAIGTRAIVAGDRFAWWVPEDELPSRPAGSEGIFGRLIAERFSNDLPGADVSFVGDETGTYSADILGEPRGPLIKFAPPVIDTTAFATCP